MMVHYHLIAFLMSESLHIALNMHTVVFKTCINTHSANIKQT